MSASSILKEFEMVQIQMTGSQARTKEPEKKTGSIQPPCRPANTCGHRPPVFSHKLNDLAARRRRSALSGLSRSMRDLYSIQQSLICSLSTPQETPPAEFLQNRFASCVSCLPFASPAVCASSRHRHRSISPSHSCEVPSQCCAQ